MGVITISESVQGVVHKQRRIFSEFFLFNFFMNDLFYELHRLALKKALPNPKPVDCYSLD